MVVYVDDIILTSDNEQTTTFMYKRVSSETLCHKGSCHPKIDIEVSSINECIFYLKLEENELLK